MFDAIKGAFGKDIYAVYYVVEQALYVRIFMYVPLVRFYSKETLGVEGERVYHILVIRTTGG